MRFKLTFLIISLVSAVSHADTYCLIDGVSSTDDATAGSIIADSTSTSAPCASCGTADPDGNAAASDAAQAFLISEIAIEAQTTTATTADPTMSPTPTPVVVATPTATPTSYTTSSTFVGPMPTATPTTTYSNTSGTMTTTW